MKYQDNREFVSGILLVQIVATYLVVFGHSYPFVTPFPDWLDSARGFLYAFHMPLFVWVSGYLLIYTRQSLKYTPGQFTARRAGKLLVPYVVLTVVAFLPKYAVQSYLNDSVSLDAESIIRVFLVPRENVWGHFWFLPMIYILGVAGYALDALFVKLKSRKLGWSVVTVALLTVYIVLYSKRVSQWFSLRDIVVFGWVFALGALCATYNVISLVKDKHCVLVASVCMIGSIAIWCNEDCPSSLIPVRNAGVAILMIVSLVELCLWIAERINISRTSVYARTFTIFLLSWPVQAIINVVAERLLHLPFYIIMPIQFIAGIAGPMILILIINRIEKKMNIRWISFCLGK